MVAGLTLAVPNIIAVIGHAANSLGSEPQVRLIEEPHLQRIHGPTYQRDTAPIGRF